jgi:hypothetical protein
LTLYREPDGQVRAYAEYHVKSGDRLIQPVAADVTDRLSGGRKSSAASIFDAVAQELAADELN